MKIAVTGAGGFVGSATAARMRDHGHEVVPVTVPRLCTTARDVTTLWEEANTAHHADLVDDLAVRLSGVDAVVNCAGLAAPTSRADDSLYGANSLLPLLLLRSCSASGAGRMVHVSTAAVLGSGILRDGWDTSPQTPYGDSKALGEQMLRQEGCVSEVSLRMLRPTSVHGLGRGVTSSLVRLARSPISSVAGIGDNPSPQVLVERVARVIEALTVVEDAPQFPVIQPWDGTTVRSVLEDLGGGARPKSVPRPLARLLVALAAGVPHPWVRGQARRVEMLWFGQTHEEGWLTSHGLAMAEPDRRAWQELSQDITSGVLE